MKSVFQLAAVVLLLVVTFDATAIEIRFQPPDFESGHGLPDLYAPAPPEAFGVWDSVILFVALSASTWLVLKGRSRRGLFMLAAFSVAFFGFYRKGCICPVGSTQNVAAAIFLPDVGVSWIVLSFFLLPLLFSLFFGRVFCAAVCPLGAIQELVAVNPIRISASLERVLGLGKYAYLGLGILGVATGSGFLICRYDPFVGLYRMGHSFNMLLAGGVILILGIFIARPYCRFLCPYGVLLGWMSHFSKYHLDVAPQGACVDCRLCEDSCPYNAMDMPIPESMVEDRGVGISRMRRMVFFAPIIIFGGAMLGYLLHVPMSLMHPTVALSERIASEDAGVFSEDILESETFRASDQTPAELYVEAMAIRDNFKSASAWFGAFMGLIIAFKLIGVSKVEKRTIFQAHRDTCFSCGRCYPYCPVEEDQIGTTEMAPAGTTL